MTEADFSAIVHAPGLPADGIVAKTPEPEYRSLRIDPNTGDFQLYGDSPGQPGAQIPAIVGRLTGLHVGRYGQAGGRGGATWAGDRPYLVVQVAVSPLLTYTLRLPVGRGQCHYRSLLGSLLSLEDLRQPFKLQGKLGKENACFVQVIIFDPTTHLEELVRQPMIDASDEQLHHAVNLLQQRLQLPPQFLTTQSDDSLIPEFHAFGHS